jgi:tetratricopeptide (TPR) repeat protein
LHGLPLDLHQQVCSHVVVLPQLVHHALHQLQIRNQKVFEQNGPDDPMLINNLAFALASANRLEEAEEIVKKINLDEVSGAKAITLAATTGLLLFRTGFPDRGRELYQLAIRRANNQQILKYRVMADLYLAREELIANTPIAHDAAARALGEASKLGEKDVAVISSQVQKLLAPAAGQLRASQS